jgi:predicted DCC family thiol-disulfide oxidoreductase YuxK
MTANNLPAHTVYFDGGCPLCRGEMALLKARNGAGRLEFVDITESGFDPAPLGASLEAMLRLIHVRGPDGSWLIGIPAFVVIYEATGFPRVARWLRRPWLVRLAAWAYPWLARHRYRPPHTLVQSMFRLQERSCPIDGACSITEDGGRA